MAQYLHPYLDLGENTESSKKSSYLEGGVFLDEISKSSVRSFNLEGGGVSLDKVSKSAMRSSNGGILGIEYPKLGILTKFFSHWA